MIIPYLREDLEIFRGNSREDGSPAWLLYDALRNKYFTLGLTAFRLIKNWRAGEDIKSFEKKINQEGIETNSEEIKSFVNFLQLNNLIVQPRGQSTNLLLQQKNSQKKNWLYFLSTFGVHTERRLSDIFIIFIMLNYVPFLLTKNSKFS